MLARDDYSYKLRVQRVIAAVADASLPGQGLASQLILTHLLQLNVLHKPTEQNNNSSYSYIILQLFFTDFPTTRVNLFLENLLSYH